MMKSSSSLKRIPINVDRGGLAKTILAGYFKYGTQTLLLGDYGTSGTVILYVEYLDSTDEREGSRGDCEEHSAG